MESCFKHKNLPLWLTRNARNLMAEALLQLFYLHPDVLDQGLTQEHQSHASSDHNPNPSLLSTAGVWNRDRSVPRTDCRNKDSHGWGTNPSFLMSPECHLIIPTADQIRGGCQDLMVNKQSIFAGQACKTSLRVPRDLIRDDLINLNNLTSWQLLFSLARDPTLSTSLAELWHYLCITCCRFCFASKAKRYFFCRHIAC